MNRFFKDVAGSNPVFYRSSTAAISGGRFALLHGRAAQAQRMLLRLKRSRLNLKELNGKSLALMVVALRASHLLPLEH